MRQRRSHTQTNTHKESVSLLSAAHTKLSACKDKNHCCGQVNNIGSRWTQEHKYNTHTNSIVMHVQAVNTRVNRRRSMVVETDLTTCHNDYIISSTSHFFPLLSIFALHPFLWANVGNQRYWTGWLMATFIYKVSHTYTLHGNSKKTQMHTNTQKHYCPTVISPSLRQIIIWP